MKVIFFGTPDIAADVFEFLLENGVQIVAVVTKPDKPKGRSLVFQPTAVKLRVLQKNPLIPVYQPELVSDLEFAPVLEQYQPDLFVVVAYGEIIKQHLLDMPKLGCINLHASLLPKYRGAAPIQRAIMNGEKISGVTIMHMAKKMDAGDIIKAVPVSIGCDMTSGELMQSLLEVGKKALLETIHDFEKGIFNRTVQDHSLATFAPKIELEDCELDWDLEAEKLHHLVRGAMPHPGSFCYVKIRGEKKRLKIKASKLEPDLQGTPGQILSADKNGIVIACKKGALRLLEIQLEGKKAMPIEEFLCGIPTNQICFI
ncbi:MAG TPA: methionyl-tRNA formyltransferase [Parachlamydiaceae bacterium]|nr:methionyl-tRNA formyltransferase [Parachlamydiaceae bacterium]